MSSQEISNLIDRAVKDLTRLTLEKLNRMAPSTRFIDEFGRVVDTLGTVYKKSVNGYVAVGMRDKTNPGKTNKIPADHAAILKAKGVIVDESEIDCEVVREYVADWINREMLSRKERTDKVFDDVPDEPLPRIGEVKTLNPFEETPMPETRPTIPHEEVIKIRERETSPQSNTSITFTGDTESVKEIIKNVLTETVKEENLPDYTIERTESRMRESPKETERMLRETLKSTSSINVTEQDWKSFNIFRVHITKFRDNSTELANIAKKAGLTPEKALFILDNSKIFAEKWPQYMTVIPTIKAPPKPMKKMGL